MILANGASHEFEERVVHRRFSLQALHATLNAAKFMGRSADLGTVERGKLADLVLLDADPLTDVAKTQKIRGVVLAGRFERPALERMLRDLEEAAAVEPLPNAKPESTP